MKQFSTILLLMLITAVSFSNLILVVEYNVNATPFAEHCINKNKPLMHCNGKCQLTAKMEETDSNTDKPGNTKLPELLSWVFAGPSLFEIKTPETGLHKKLVPSINDNSLRKQPRTHFHPPGNIL